MAGICSYLTICLHVKSDGTLIILKFLYKKALLLQVEFFKNLWTERAWGGGWLVCSTLNRTSENGTVSICRIQRIKLCVLIKYGEGNHVYSAHSPTTKNEAEHIHRVRRMKLRILAVFAKWGNSLDSTLSAISGYIWNEFKTRVSILRQKIIYA